MEQYKQDIFEHNGLNETAKAHLLETTRWTKFLAIIGFIFMGLMLLGILFFMIAGSTLSAYAGSGAGVLGATGFGLIYLILIMLYIYPIFCLYKFSGFIKDGLHTNNQELLTEGFRYQKSMYKFMGILTIIVLSFYLLAMVFGLLAAAIA